MQIATSLHFCFHGPVFHKEFDRGCAMLGPAACLDANHARPVPHYFVTRCTLGGLETKEIAAAQKVPAAHPTFKFKPATVNMLYGRLRYL